MSNTTSNTVSDTIVCIPTYNEAENIRALIALILSTEPHVDVLVVDDNSPDGTARVVEKLQWSLAGGPTANKVHLLKRFTNKGFANSYKDGFQWAYAHQYKYLIQMDADFSHHPRYLASMLALRTQYDIVSGSRYSNGGKIINWPLKRRLLSAGGNLYVRLWLGCPIRDMTTGYNLWSLEALRIIDLSKLESDGYSFLIELKFFSTRAALRSTEVPIVFEDRKAQESKMSGKIFKEAVIQVPLLRIKSFLNPAFGPRVTSGNAPVFSTITGSGRKVDTSATSLQTDTHKKVVGQ